MPTWGDETGNGGTTWEQEQTIPEQIRELKDDLGRWTYKQDLKYRAFEDWIAGPGGETIDLAAAVGGIITAMGVGGPVAATAAAGALAAKAAYGTHIGSNWAMLAHSWVWPDLYAAPTTPTGWMPSIYRDTQQTVSDGAAILDDTGAIRTSTAGLTGEDVDAIALAVWNIHKWFYPMTGSPYQMAMFETLQQCQSVLTQIISSRGLPIAGNPDFLLVLGDVAWLPDVNPAWGDYQGVTLPAPIVFDDMTPGQTLLSYLQSAQPAIAWTYTGPDGARIGADDTIWAPVGGVTGAWWKCLYSDRIIALNAGPTPVSSPVWPGIANVTLGTPVPFTHTLYHVEDMDGCVLTITDVPPGQSAYPEAGTTRYKGIGWIAFHSDNGDLGNHQQIEWPSCVFTPQNMTRAAGIDVWTKPNTSGILTPWVHNP